VTSGEQVSPSLYVIYVRDVMPGDGQSQEAQNHILQQWMVVAALQGNPDQMLAKAGELLAKARCPAGLDPGCRAV
jgi:phosphatidate phosphatase APP1